MVHPIIKWYTLMWYPLYFLVPDFKSRGDPTWTRLGRTNYMTHKIWDIIALSTICNLYPWYHECWTWGPIDKNHLWITIHLNHLWFMNQFSIFFIHEKYNIRPLWRCLDVRLDMPWVFFCTKVALMLQL